jgi:hypothetical protein
LEEGLYFWVFSIVGFLVHLAHGSECALHIEQLFSPSQLDTQGFTFFLSPWLPPPWLLGCWRRWVCTFTCVYIHMCVCTSVCAHASPYVSMPPGEGTISLSQIMLSWRGGIFTIGYTYALMLPPVCREEGPHPDKSWNSITNHLRWLRP